jgi:hypothetical protein
MSDENHFNPRKVSHLPGFLLVLVKLFALAVSASLISCSEEPQENAEIQAAKASVVARFKSPSEPSVRDAIWTSKNMLKVGVLDDGTSRNGFANYICEELKSFGLNSGYRVEIVDYASVVAGKAWKELGSADCK